MKRFQNIIQRDTLLRMRTTVFIVILVSVGFVSGLKLANKPAKCLATWLFCDQIYSLQTRKRKGNAPISHQVYLTITSKHGFSCQKRISVYL